MRILFFRGSFDFRFFFNDTATTEIYTLSLHDALPINARPGNELKHNAEKLLTHYLRVGYTREGGWRTFTLRSDFFPAEKIQVEDDITASAVAPRGQVPCLPAWVTEPSLKF